jgi:Mitochondrial carrier protein
MLIYEREGMRGYFRGFLPSVIKVTLNAGTYFSSLYYLRLLLMQSTAMSDHVVNFWASSLARALETTLGNPLIVIKTRLEVLGFKEYNSMFDAF